MLPHMLARHRHLEKIADLLSQSPVVALLGPRQVGKTTLSRHLANAWPQPVHAFDLEDPDDLARLSDPSFVLRPLTGLVILDEIQRRPDLFPLLRVLADRAPTTARFLVLGSASPELIRRSSESLAGRIAFHEIDGFGLDELPAGQIEQRWLRGGFPRAYLAASAEESVEWREALIRTYLERDLPQLGINLSAVTLRRFWTMLAHYHGQTWNGSELGRALGVSDKTVARYLDILEATFMTFRLRPWHTNLGKREVKAAKVYVADSGLLHRLLAIDSYDRLLAHPKCGASWEGFAIAEILRRTATRRSDAYFWSTHTGAELDLLVFNDDRRFGFEIKLSNSPALTPSMRSAIAALELDHLYVVCSGEGAPWPLAERITALPLASIWREFPATGA
jgi:predicted AAA+ superfamily ATPase